MFVSRNSCDSGCEFDRTLADFVCTKSHEESNAEPEPEVAAPEPEQSASPEPEQSAQPEPENSASPEPEIPSIEPNAEVNSIANYLYLKSDLF